MSTDTDDMFYGDGGPDMDDKITEINEAIGFMVGSSWVGKDVLRTGHVERLALAINKALIVAQGSPGSSTNFRPAEVSAAIMTTMMHVTNLMVANNLSTPDAVRCIAGTGYELIAMHGPDYIPSPTADVFAYLGMVLGIFLDHDFAPILDANEEDVATLASNIMRQIDGANQWKAILSILAVVQQIVTQAARKEPEAISHAFAMAGQHVMPWLAGVRKEADKPDILA